MMAQVTRNSGHDAYPQDDEQGADGVGLLPSSACWLRRELVSSRTQCGVSCSHRQLI